MQKHLPWIVRLIGPTLLALFLLNSDIPQLIAILRGAKPTPILLSLLLIFPFLLIKGWRWQQIVQELGQKLPLRTTTALYTVGVYLGSITPGQSGDLIKAWYLRKEGMPLGPALWSVLIDRLFDMIIMSFLAILGLFALGHHLPHRNLQTLIVIAMATSLILLLTALSARIPRQWLLLTLLPTLAPSRTHPRLKQLNTQLTTLAMHPRLLLPLTLASLISAWFTFVRLWLLFGAINVALPLYIVIGSSALIAILQVLPISIAGVGVRDAVLIATLAPHGYPTEQALGLSALFLLLTIEQTIVGFIVSFWYPIEKREP